MIGSVFERRSTTNTDFPICSHHSRFTDHTVLTVATAYATLNGVPDARAYHHLGRRNPSVGYGGAFIEWLRSSTPLPLNRWGNRSAMRVSRPSVLRSIQQSECFLRAS